MIDIMKSPENNTYEAQCQHFVTRKKRLCRMTVRPGRHYCGEHDPHPKSEDGKTDERIPCPNDPKHTCYISKLEKHLAICNARPAELPPYVEMHINAPPALGLEPCERRPLAQIPRNTLRMLIDKVNTLYEKHIKDSISTASPRPIHSAVAAEFNAADRAESSLRHLRQASSLLHLAEDEGLVADGTCYVELGAGKGHLSYYMCSAWCQQGASASRVLVVDRASLRHKRDNVVRAHCTRLRADLAHLALHRVPLVAECRAGAVGLAKHLCGVATDYALRCMVGGEARCRGLVIATCCHHRCDRSAYVANHQLQELGVSGEELNGLLGIVSWATCGDGRSRAARAAPAEQAAPEAAPGLSQEDRELVGRRAKALLDWGRVLYLRHMGFDARLCHFVPAAVSLENVCIVATKLTVT